MVGRAGINDFKVHAKYIKVHPKYRNVRTKYCKCNILRAATMGTETRLDGKNPSHRAPQRWLFNLDLRAAPALSIVHSLFILRDLGRQLSIRRLKNGPTLDRLPGLKKGNHGDLLSGPQRAHMELWFRAAERFAKTWTWP